MTPSRRTQIPEDALLQPSLTETRRTRPKKCWDPKSVVFASFFVGPIGSALLIAINNSRLDCRNLRWLWALATITIPFLIVIPGIAEHYVENKDTYSPLIRPLMIAGQVGATYFATRPQVVPYHVYEHDGYSAERIFGFAFGAFVINTLLLMLLGSTLPSLLGAA